MLTTPSSAPDHAGASASGDAAGAPRPPGALLQALGWMAQPMAALARHRPALAPVLLGLDRAQLHLLGFALAHERIEPGAGALAAGGASVRAVLRALGMEKLAGLGRVLRQLREEALQARDYRQIAELLADPATAEILHHNAAVIEKDCLRNFAGLPPALRTLPIVLALDDTPGGARVLLDWIALVADRRGDRDGGHVIGHLAATGSRKELRARILRLVDSLPVPAGLPPAVIANARRLDTSTEIRRVAHAFGNCLRDRVNDVACGASLFYLWRTEDQSVVCELRRINRLGWALCEALGPKNATPGDDAIRGIEADFRRAGIWPQLVADFADTMVCNLGDSTPRAEIRTADRIANRNDIDLDDGDDDDDDPPPRRRPRWPGL